MIKKIIFAVSSGLLAAGVSIGYSTFFKSQTEEDYSSVMPVSAIFIACLVGTVLATLGHWVITKFIPRFGEFIFALIFAGVSTASLISVILFNFGDKCQECDQIAFWGYAMPMHFFPFLAWFTLRSFFDEKK